MHPIQTRPLLYQSYDIVFQEIPNEITLALNIAGCQHRCQGCHSKYLWEYKGTPLRLDVDFVINKHKDILTCVCFMGGDQNQDELIEILKQIQLKYRLMTALYSGYDSIRDVRSLIPYLDYCKIGSYKENLGGLNSKNTNQRMYMIKSDSSKIQLKDITSEFQRKVY
jgi:anaerobic ribonucleoside-triphosphate reductase activating protein